MELREAIDSHSTETVDTSWDGPANEDRLPNDADVATMRQAYAWEDEELDPDDPAKSDFAFIHHEINEDGTVGAANVTAAQTGIATLNGARLDQPASEQRWGDDREGIWDHLAEHLRDADVEPPELRRLIMANYYVKSKNRVGKKYVTN